MKHLLIAFSWSISNIGDIGITPGLLTLIKEKNPKRRAVVLALHREGDSAIPYLQDYLPRYLPGCRVVPNPIRPLLHSDAAGKSHAERGIEPGAWQAFQERWGPYRLAAFDRGCLAARTAQAMADDILQRLPGELYAQMQKVNPVAAEAFANAGFVVFNSGTVLNFGRAGKRRFWQSPFQLAMPLILARHLGIPYGINAHSFDALEWPSDLVYRPLFRDAQFVFCRDSDSLLYLNQRNLGNSRSGFRPDSTFFFRGEDEEWAADFLKRHGLKEKEFITVTIRTSAQPGPLQGVMEPEREERHMEKLRAFIERWTVVTGQKVLLCPEVRWEVEAAGERIFKHLSPQAKEKCVWLDHFWTTEQAGSIYRKARIVVSMEMHSIIMAFGLGTPVLHPQFSEAGRKAWMLEDIGVGDWLFDIDEMEAEELLKAAFDIHENYPAAEARVTEGMKRLHQLGSEVVDLIETTGRWS
ncbi:MAG TPA: polysaccharide pyruvyl transferase family protein [Firmicutes bacterium]|nr:polysaccharide pyruvyl transferase family protein [Bacillota bacterium]